LFNKNDHSPQEPVSVVQAQDLLIEPSQVGSFAADAWQPLGFVDLNACADTVRLSTLPPFPLIGLGDPSHPLAAALDAVVEPPVSVEALIRHIARAPRAAAIAIQLLRSLEGLPGDRALQLESICYGLLQGSAEHVAWLATRAPAAPAAELGKLRVERQGEVLQLVIDRSQAYNAIDRSLRDQLFEAFTVAALDPEVLSIKLRAVGRTFSIGGDLEEFGTTRDPATAHLIRSRTLPAQALCARAGILDVHVQGACVGAGLEMAAFAGRLTAASGAWFQLPELAMGVIPGAGGCVSVPRRIGRQRAALMILSGRRINATTARHWGLIDAIEEQSINQFF
jgi:enoyl-CoA hydratase/carnithine racemase